MTDDDITAISSAALLNSFSKALNNVAMLCALASLLLLGLTKSNDFIIVSFIFYLVQSYFYARCVFDATIFNTLTGNSTHYQSFDNALTQLGLPKTFPSTRPLNDRIKGAMRLLRWQAVSLFIQIALLAFGLY